MGGVGLRYPRMLSLRFSVGRPVAASVAALCVVGGFIAIGYVIYAAPILLAEVALDAAIMSALYRRLRREDASHWAMTVVRKTWLPALALMIVAAVAGYALQLAVPDARSIGGVMRALNE